MSLRLLAMRHSIGQLATSETESDRQGQRYTL
jgi:hypothetical protein